MPTSIAQKAALRLRTAQGFPGNEQADPENSNTDERMLLVPETGYIKKRQLRPMVLQYLTELRDAAQIGHWRDAARINDILKNYIKAAQNYIEGKSPILLEGPGMPTQAGLKVAIIKHEGNNWNLYSHKGKLLGSHPSEEKALAQERAIEVSKHG